MAKKDDKPDKLDTLSGIMDEVNQRHRVRKELYDSLEKELGENSKVVSFFTSFTYPVLIEDGDADMLEEVLTNSDMDGKKLVLFLNSPGGDALAAERIVNICRSYSKKGFSVIVPKMAKSAATMIALGATTIGMSKTSELGPIDPQILIYNDKGDPVKYQAANEIIESYNDLLNKANKTTGRIEPYLQQLARYDARDIRNIQSAQSLSENIAVKSLKSGMLKNLTEGQIKNKIQPFLDPKHTKSHGRPIYHDLAEKCGAKVKLYENNSDLWRIVWQLYVKLNYLVSTSSIKIIESYEDSYVASAPQV
jgi:ATP-dependent protease ClpP protease subunit